MTTALKFYAIRNPDGKWLRKSNDPSWTDDINKARIYNRIGPARGRLTYLAGNCRGFQAELVEFEAGPPVVIDESVRIGAAIERRAKWDRRWREP